MNRPDRLANKEIVFFLANYYSGATLLAFFLNNHLRLICNGETFPFKASETHFYTCSCGKKLNACDFYLTCADQFRLSDLSNQHHPYFSINPDYKTHQWANKLVSTLAIPYFFRKSILEWSSSLRDQRDTFLNLHLDFIHKACQYKNANIYIDNTKSIQRCELFLDLVQPHIKIIHLIRDGRAYFHSYKKANPTTTESDPFIAHKWQGYLNEISRLKAAHRSKLKLLIIRYEDLCENPIAELQRICAFLAVEFDENMYLKQKYDHHILGNKMRLNFDWTFKKNSEVWRKELSGEEIDLCNRLQKNGLKECAYH
ncbi:MAG: sulfotransferase [Candidatus Competibacteraceae bacterium]|nr:sulfotransferase [Candidatus Competibacteraceae bacterium]